MTEALFTQFAALLAAALLMPAFVFLAYGVNHRNMTFWWVIAAAYLAIFGGSVLSAMRSTLPELVYGLGTNVLVGLGYFLCLRAIRMIKGCWQFAKVDAAVTAAYLVALVLVIAGPNGYEHRIIVVSGFIAVMSFIALLIALDGRSRLSVLGDAAIILFALGNSSVSALRAASAAFSETTPWLSLALWDKAFFVWSIGAVFCFAIGFFISGTAVIASETRAKLDREQRLTSALNEALEGQRDLQKLLLHELKRPINAISTAVEMLRAQAGQVAEEDLKRLARLTRAANGYLEGISGFEVVNALLETPAFAIVPVPLIAEDVSKKWGVWVGVDPYAADRAVCADPLLLDIALGNIIENARKFARNQQNVSLHVGLENGLVTFDVADDGPGVSESERERVFRKFYKVGGGSRNALQGCGLGLYVVRRIALSHSGTALVLCQRPSTIRFALPAVDPGGLE